MDLPSTFEYQAWKIRYTLLSSPNQPAGPPPRSVVFVHGTPWSSAVFQPLIKALLASSGPWQILAYDLAGYGRSQVYRSESNAQDSSSQLFAGDTSVKFQAEALAALLEHVQMDGRQGRVAPAVVAHDIAGAIVLRAHLLHGCEFESMLFMDTNTVLPWGDTFYKLVRSNAETFLQLPAKIYEAVVRAAVQSACHNPEVLRTGWEEKLMEPWVDDAAESGVAGERQRSFVRQIAQANDADVAEMIDGNMYEKVRCDVRMLWGQNDQWIPRHKMEDLERRLQGRAKGLVVIPNAGHLIMLDQPERVALEVFTWLTRSS